MASLEIVTGARAGEIVELDGDETLIGRHPSCTIVFPLHTVSRRHTLIRQNEGAYYVQDMESLNGTYVNGERVETAIRLKDHDVLQLFDIVMVFHDGPALPDSSTDANLNLTLHLLEDDTTNPPDAQEVLSASDVNRASHIRLGTDVKLTAVLEITRNLSGSLDVDEVLPKILDNLFFVFPQANRAYILLADERSGELKTRATKRRDRKETFGPISRTIAQRVMSQREAILSADVSSDERLSNSDSLSELQIRSMMCAPLMGPSQVPLGIIHVETSDVFHRFQLEDLDVLVTIATVAGQAVEHTRATDALLRFDRKEREMAMARDVQLHFLPQRPPEVRGYSFFQHYQAAQQVGGDYFGYIPLTGGRLAVAIGDVSGKGVPAALLMARLCSETRAYLLDAETPAAALGQLNRDYEESMYGGRFVTMAICVLDPRKHELTVVNAGHPSPLLRRAATRDVIELGPESKALPLGFGADEEYTQSTVQLQPGDVVLMYTDGLSEAQDPANNFYGYARVRDMLGNGPADVPLLGEVLLRHVNQFVKNQPPGDDMCIVAFGRERA
jgi:serine phosphatase RsbU (regulator of sigma subunit)/pSer/pThr/pTyr-binding forkhead associated (FHA) protein